MARQSSFYLSAEDLGSFLAAVLSDRSVEIIPKELASLGGGGDIWPLGSAPAVLWNKEIASHLEKEQIDRPDGLYEVVDLKQPVIELLPCHRVSWDDCEALLAGRVYCSFVLPSPGLDRWYKQIYRKLRSTCDIVHYGGYTAYIGPAALKFVRNGGLLLPLFVPPVSDQWKEWAIAFRRQVLLIEH
jgi:hypothetical protein